MIERLRGRHRRVVALLCVALPIGFVAGLLVRPEFPVQAADPALRLPTGAAGAENGWRYFELEAGGELALRVVGEDGGTLLEIQPEADPQRPDVLVYWSAAVPEESSALPAGAALLGALSGAELRRLPLPAGTSGDEGTLYLYSLGRQEIVGRVFLEEKHADPEGEG